MFLAFPKVLGVGARNRLASALAQAELDQVPPVELVVGVFSDFVYEFLEHISSSPDTAADEARMVATRFLSNLTRTVYEGYPESVPQKKVLWDGRIGSEHSFCNWRDLPGFRLAVMDDLRPTQAWRDLQAMVVELAERPPDVTPEEEQAATGSGADVLTAPREMLRVYKDAFPRVSYADIYRAAEVHSSDFYRWRRGDIAPSAKLSRRLTKFLKNMQAPPPSIPRARKT